MEYIYKVKRTVRRGVKGAELETGPISGPHAYGMAFRHAIFWSEKPETKSANLLRADASGINEGKFFLYQIVKV